MKYITAATVISCFLLAEATSTSDSTTTSALSSSILSASVSSIDALNSLSSAGFDINVPSEEEEEEEENSPILESVVAAHEDKEEEEEEEEKEKEKGKKKQSSVKTNNKKVEVSAEVDENVFASAGLVYNKDIDLPVFRNGRTTKDLPPVPEVIACRSEGQIAITYSEGPSDTTARIARQLLDRSTRGNFFVNTLGLSQQKYAMVLENAYNAGHFIGMTYRLPSEDPESLSDEEIKKDIIKNAEMVESIIKVSPKYVRLHFSAQSDGRTEHILRDLGFILVGYNLDGKDYVHETPELVAKEYSNTFKKYMDRFESKGSFIAIQYDIPETSSLLAVPNIMDVIEEEGFIPVRMDGCLNDAKPYKKTAAGLDYVADNFSFGSSGYPLKKVQNVITNTTAEEDLRVLAADDTFLNTSDAPVTLSRSIGLALIPALVYAFLI